MVERQRQRRQHVLMKQTAGCEDDSAVVVGEVVVVVAACDVGRQQRVNRVCALVEYAALCQTRRPSEHDRVNGRPEGYAR